MSQSDTGANAATDPVEDGLARASRAKSNTIAPEDDLTPVEQKVWQAAQVGLHIDLRVGDQTLDRPDKGTGWGRDRTIRAEVVARLLRGDGNATGFAVRAVWICGARISGKLDLEASTLRCPLTLMDCYFDGDVVLNEASMSVICFSGSRVPSIRGRQLITRGNLFLDDGFVSEGEVNLAGAHIGGQLVCSAGQFLNSNGPAVRADGMTVDLDVLWDAGFTATGEVRMLGANIHGRLQCTGGAFGNGGEFALRADQTTVGQSVNCDDSFRANGEVSLVGAHIIGDLNCRGGQFANSKGPALNVDGITVDHDVYCDVGFNATGEVRLLGAHISGQLECGGGRFSNPGGRAISADGLTVGQDMDCDPDFVATGEVSLLGADIAGQLQFSGQFLNQNASAISADQLTVGQTLYCDEGFYAYGMVSIIGAHIASDLICTGGHFNNDPSDIALDASRIEVTGRLACDGGFTAVGQVNVAGARLGSLKCTDGSFKCSNGPGLNADGLTVGSDMRCDGQFAAEGGVRLTGAHIDGQLQMSSAHLSDTEGTALSADGLEVDQDVFCDAGFTAKGQVRLIGAHIQGQLLLSGAHLEWPNDIALYADDITVDEAIFCDEDFTSVGQVSLVGAHTVKLDCTGGHFSRSDDDAVDLTGIEADQLVFKPASLDGGLNLMDARVRRYEDDKRTWPTNLSLSGFTYESLVADGVKVKDRLAWLRRDGYVPHNYDQLAASYHKAGLDSDAEQVAMEKQRQRRSQLTPAATVWNFVLEWTVGYGYRTWMAGVWFIGLLAIGAVMFQSAYPNDLKPVHTGSEQPEFQPVLYALDLLLPVISLNQRGSWVPHGLTQWWMLGFSLAGWILTTAIVLSLTGILKRSDGTGSQISS